MGEEVKGGDIDRGRAWVVLVASYLGNTVFTAIYYTSGVVYVALIRHFKDDVIKTSLIGSINGGLFCILGPVSAFAINRFNCRVTTVFGGLIMAISFLISAFVPNVDCLIFTFGVLGAIGSTFAGIPVAVVPGFSFKRYRETVLTLASVMIGLGMLISSPMMLLILDEWGLQGGFIILSGISLQLCVIGVLLKPSSIERQLKTQRLLDQRHFDRELTEGLLPEEKDTKSKCKNFIDTLKIIIPGSILKVLSFDFFLISTMAWNLMTAVCQMHLPNYMVVQGDHPSHIALIMTCFGVSNTVGRLFGTVAVSYREQVNLLYWHIVLLVLSGIVASTFPIYKTFSNSEVAFSVIAGFCTGGANGLLTPITLRILGLEHLSAGYGLNFFFCGVGFLTGPPIASALYRRTGAYDASFIFAGCVSLAGSLAAVLAFINLPKRVDQTEQRLDNTGEEI